MSARHRRQTLRPTRRRVAAALAAGGVVLTIAVILAVAPLLPRSSSPPPGSDTHVVVISMAGFSPDHVTIPADRPVQLVIVNPDSQFHTDGGGWHQFAIDALRIDARIPPHSRHTVTLGPLSAGVYEFYCDVCCGGRINPSMRGVLEVTG